VLRLVTCELVPMVQCSKPQHMWFCCAYRANRHYMLLHVYAPAVLCTELDLRESNSDLGVDMVGFETGPLERAGTMLFHVLELNLSSQSKETLHVWLSPFSRRMQFLLDELHGCQQSRIRRAKRPYPYLRRSILVCVSRISE
jgi:hypothetical protein